MVINSRRKSTIFGSGARVAVARVMPVYCWEIRDCIVMDLRVGCELYPWQGRTVASVEIRCNDSYEVYYEG